MATINFYLKEKNKKSETLIYIFFSFDGKRLKISTGEKIHPRHWNEEEQVVRKSLEGYVAFNESLEKFGEQYKEAYRLLKSLNQKITPDSIRKKVDQLTQTINPENTGFFNFIEDFITNSVYRVKHGTIKSYKTTQAVLKKLQKYRNKRIDFDSINLGFYDEFIYYQAKKLQYSANTIGKNVKNLKVFMNESTERGLNNNLEYLKKGFKVMKEDIDNIYLSEDEILELYNLDLSGKKTLDHIRDLFIVGCYTGLRFSDFSQIKRENIHGGLISLRTQKTNELVTIPVHPLVNAIMQKYKGQYSNSLPPSYPNQTMNDNLKILGEMAKFEEQVIIKKTKAGKKEELTFKKYQIIATHTARRSFATNLFLSEFPSISIMKITGHRIERAFMQYIKMTPHENAEKLRLHWEKAIKKKEDLIDDYSSGSKIVQMKTRT